MILSLALLLSGRLDTRPAQQLQAEEAAASPPRQSEVRSSHSPGETTLRVLEAGGFRVGAVVRIHEGHPNQEDHRVRYITPSTLRLEGAGLELHHNRGERVVQLAVDEDCPRNCSGRAACVDGACNCPAAYAGDDCSIEVSACPGDCSGHGACVYGACHCERGYAGGSCQFVEQLCSSNCSGHGICSPSGRCACEPGFGGEDCSIAAPDCPSNCTGHGVCLNSECTCDFGFAGPDCSAVVGGCPGNCSAHGECLRDGSCLCEPGFTGNDCGVASAFSGLSLIHI